MLQPRTIDYDRGGSRHNTVGERREWAHYDWFWVWAELIRVRAPDAKT